MVASNSATINSLQQETASSAAWPYFQNRTNTTRDGPIMEAAEIAGPIAKITWRLQMTIIWICPIKLMTNNIGKIKAKGSISMAITVAIITDFKGIMWTCKDDSSIKKTNQISILTKMWTLIKIIIQVLNSIISTIIMASNSIMDFNNTSIIGNITITWNKTIWIFNNTHSKIEITLRVLTISNSNNFRIITCKILIKINKWTI